MYIYVVKKYRLSIKEARITLIFRVSQKTGSRIVESFYLFKCLRVIYGVQARQQNNNHIFLGHPAYSLYYENITQH